MRQAVKNIIQVSLLPMGIAILMSGPVQAGDIDSIYTDLDLNECSVLHADDFGVSFACPGYRGYPLWVAEGDLRMFVSYGFGAPKEKAATQTMPQFNTLGKKIEWRVENQAGVWVPFATILRWHTQVGDGSAPDGETLVVTKLEPGNVCHVAYVDTKILATPGANANQIAREWADKVVPGFDCENDEPYYYPS